jgi:hypothetical protein
VSAATLAHRSLKNVEQRASHAALSQDVSRVPAPPMQAQPGRLDAIVVPASRPAFCLQPAIDLAARLDILLVVLCSKQTRADHVAERVSSSPGARALIVDLPRPGATRTFLLEHPAKSSERRTATERAT